MTNTHKNSVGKRKYDCQEVAMKVRKTLLDMYHLGWKMQTNVEEAVKMFLKGIWDLIKIGYLDSSADKESTCNAGDPNLSPGSVRSPGERIGYPIQYSWASLVAQRVKNLPAMWETWVWSVGWEDSLEEGMANHSNILAWRIPRNRGTWWATVHGVAKSWTCLSD